MQEGERRQRVRGKEEHGDVLGRREQKTRLMAKVGGKQDNLYNTFFDDYATANLDGDVKGMAPFTGIFRPKFSMKRLIRGVDGKKHRAAYGGSRGSWSVTVRDRSLAPGEEPRGTIDGMTLILCTREKSSEMPGFVPFSEALRRPQPMPEVPQVPDEPDVPDAVEGSGNMTEAEDPQVEGFSQTFSQFNPLLEPLQFWFRQFESLWFFYFSTIFWGNVIHGQIPDPGPYELSEPIPFP